MRSSASCASACESSSSLAAASAPGERRPSRARAALYRPRRAAPAVSSSIGAREQRRLLEVLAVLSRSLRARLRREELVDGEAFRGRNADAESTWLGLSTTLSIGSSIRKSRNGIACACARAPLPARFPRHCFRARAGRRRAALRRPISADGRLHARAAAAPARSRARFRPRAIANVVRLRQGERERRATRHVHILRFVPAATMPSSFSSAP